MNLVHYAQRTPTVPREVPTAQSVLTIPPRFQDPPLVTAQKDSTSLDLTVRSVLQIPTNQTPPVPCVSLVLLIQTHLQAHPSATARKVST